MLCQGPARAHVYRGLDKVCRLCGNLGRQLATLTAAGYSSARNSHLVRLSTSPVELRLERRLPCLRTQAQWKHHLHLSPAYWQGLSVQVLFPSTCRYDWARTWRMTLFQGLLLGPLGHVYYTSLDAVGGKSFSV